MDQEKKNPNEAANDADDTAKKQDVTAQAADTPAAPADDKEEKEETMEVVEVVAVVQEKTLQGVAVAGVA